jgi:squalene synthase HpnC
MIPHHARPSPPRPGDPKPTLLARAAGHYENFPVASWLCPPALRPAVVAIYRFARTADDVADEGDATPTERLPRLAALREALYAAAAGRWRDDAWPDVFAPLARTIADHALPVALLDDLLRAFEQDVHHTAGGHRYANLDELLAYCRLSANPIGRLLLHLYRIGDARSLRESDAICSALQLINFWQDLGRDHARGRHYLPADVLARHGVRVEDFVPGNDDTRCAHVVRELCEDARQRMLAGADLALRVPGRAGWELRLVVQGGLRILDHCAGLGWRTWHARPTLRARDLPLMAWRAWRQRTIAP